MSWSREHESRRVDLASCQWQHKVAYLLTSLATTKSRCRVLSWLTPNIYHLQMIWTYEMISSVDPKLQDDTGQQQDNKVEVQ